MKKIYNLFFKNVFIMGILVLVNGSEMMFLDKCFVVFISGDIVCGWLIKYWR